MLVIGTDEAGYGPNLGPLTITATMWRVPDAEEHDLYRLLDEAVCDAHRGPDDERIRLADSKELYSPGLGVATLERGVWAALGALGIAPEDDRALWGRIAPDSLDALERLPWHREHRLSLPRELSPTTANEDATRLRRALRGAGVELLAVRSCVLFPAEFNAAVERLGNKSECLSHATLGLLAELVATAEGEPVRVQCDKHGGRNRYAALLQHHFPEHLVHVLHESREESRYRWGPRGAEVECQFAVGGERFLPAALASMMSKFLRELAMESFNAFWASRVEGLKPTAGYPVDARRFHSQIRAAQAELAIDDDLLWRKR